MSVSLVDLKIKGVKTFANEEFYINFRNEKRGTASDIEKHVVTTMAGSNYRNNVIALAGVNASGKTTALRLINFALLVFIAGDSLNQHKGLAELFRHAIEVRAHLLIDQTLICFTADIVKSANNGTAPVHLSFKEERFVQKKLKENESHRGFLDISTYEDEQVRSKLDDSSRKFLKDDDSMIPSFFPQLRALKHGFVNSAIKRANFNMLLPYAFFPEALYAYFDSSIEEFSKLEPEATSQQESAKFRLKFYGENPIEGEISDLNHYLSSGTIRGLNIFSEIAATLYLGGYMIIDELEIHFNKVIVENIISFFQSDINKNGATLVFTTHYSEILDYVTRKDAIKVLRKDNEGIKIDSLAQLAKTKDKDRTDIKNSDLILSGIFKTAPSYEKYWEVSQLMNHIVEKSTSSDEDSVHEENDKT